MESINAKKYSEKFLNEDFSPYRHLADSVNIGDKLSKTNLPAIEVPGLDVQALLAVHEYCTKHKDLFNKVASGQLFDDWFNVTRSEGWSDICINVPEVTSFKVLHDNTVHYRKNNKATQDQTLIDLTDKAFGDIAVKQFRIFSLEPGGWINPHKDISTETNNLYYFWIPLHDFSPCLKVFPLGWLQHRLGCMYLFNNKKYVHAVRNHTNENRLVMAGRLDPDRIDDRLIQAYEAGKSNWTSLWKV